MLYEDLSHTNKNSIKNTLNKTAKTDLVKAAPFYVKKFIKKNYIYLKIDLRSTFDPIYIKRSTQFHHHIILFLFVCDVCASKRYSSVGNNLISSLSILSEYCLIGASITWLYTILIGSHGLTHSWLIKLLVFFFCNSHLDSIIHTDIDFNLLFNFFFYFFWWWWTISYH